MRLRLPEHLHSYCEGRSSVCVEGDTVAAILQDLAAKFPDTAIRVLDEESRLQSHLVVIHNDRVLGQDDLPRTRVSEGDDLQLFTAASGG